MSKKRREGDFYAAKVRLFLNEYSGISLEEFCKAENVSYNKMCNCLGRPSYRKESDSPQPSSETQATSDAEQMELPEMELKPLVIDMEPDNDIDSDSFREVTAMRPRSTNLGYLCNVHLHTVRQTEIIIGKCPVKVLAALIREMEAAPC